MTKQPTPRQKRLRPNRAKLTAPWVYTDTDEKILTFLARYRYLRGTSLHELVGGSKATVNYSLRKLYDRRLIDKPKSQALGYNSLNDTDIYELTKKGAEWLNKSVPEATNLLRTVSDAPVVQFRHSMMICDTLSSLEIGARLAGCTFITQAEILARVTHPHPMKLPCTVSHTWPNGSTHRADTHLLPDGVFGIGYSDGRTRLFLLEAEHYNPLMPTNLNRASFLKKIIAYTDIRAKKAIRQLGKSNFTVLFVFPTKSRALHASEIVAMLYGKSDLFMINHTPVQEELWRSPRPFPELFNAPWLRGGLPPATIKEPPAK